MDNRWGKVLGIAVLVSLVANGWLYLQLAGLKKGFTAEEVATQASNTPEKDSEIIEEVRSQSPASVAIPQLVASTNTKAVDETARVEPRSEEECKALREEQMDANRLEQIQKLLDPTEREKMKQDNIRSLGMMYSDAAESMGVTEELIDRLKELEAEYQLEKTQQAMEGILDRTESINSFGELDINPWIVSDQGYEMAQKWAEYKQNNMMNSMLISIAGPMATADVPLTPEQRQQYFKMQNEVSKKLAEQRQAENQALSSTPTNVEELIAQREDSVRYQQQRNQAIEQQASAFLSDQQMQVLKSINAQSQSMMNMMVDQIRTNPERVKITVRRDENGCANGYSTFGG